MAIDGKTTRFMSEETTDDQKEDWNERESKLKSTL
jgi:hypothetical protein